MKFSFRPGLSIAVAISLAILCSLGVWQLKRLEWKRGIIAQMTERLASEPIALDAALAREAAGENLEYQPIFIDAVYENQWEAPVFGTYEGAAGVYVFTPATLDDHRLVYVNRGFAPQDFRDQATRAQTALSGRVRIEGLLRHAENRVAFEKWLAPEDQPQDNLYFTRDPKKLAAARNLDALNVYIDSFGRESAGGWPRGGLTRLDIPNRHFEYALTWFGLAAALIGVFMAFSIKKD